MKKVTITLTAEQLALLEQGRIPVERLPEPSPYEKGALDRYQDRKRKQRRKQRR